MGGGGGEHPKLFAKLTGVQGWSARSTGGGPDRALRRSLARIAYGRVYTSSVYIADDGLRWSKCACCLQRASWCRELRCEALKIELQSKQPVSTRQPSQRHLSKGAVIHAGETQGGSLKPLRHPRAVQGEPQLGHLARRRATRSGGPRKHSNDSTRSCDKLVFPPAPGCFPHRQPMGQCILHAARGASLRHSVHNVLWQPPDLVRDVARR